MMGTTMDPRREAWHREAERLHQRYLIEVVEACGFCPWAESARRLGRTRTAVVLETGDAAASASLELLDAWALLPDVEVGFLIFPRLSLARPEFDRFVAQVRSLDVSARPLGEAPFALAAFHPGASLDRSEPARLVPYLRRTPDPCVQLVRMSTLERVRSRAPHGTQFVDLAMLEAAMSSQAQPALADQIARANLDRVLGMGVEALAARIDDIRCDRDRTYAALDAEAIAG